MAQYAPYNGQPIITRSKVYDEGLIALSRSGYGYSGSSSAAANGEIVIIRTRTARELIVIEWEVTREGAPPDAPHHSIFDPNLVFIGGEQKAVVPVHVTAGIKAYSLAGKYTYVAKLPDGLSTAIPTGKLPYESGPASANTIPASTFKQGLLDDKMTFVNPL
jgi:hypothetical protein